MVAKSSYEQYLTKVKPEENKKDLIEAYTYMGVYLLNMKDFCAAKIQFKKVLDLDPANSNAKKFLDSPESKKCP